jgi:uncharacterized protein (TIGR02271 family)
MADSYSSRTLTALFDDRSDAEEAVSRLRSLGISDTSIRMTGGDDYSGRTEREYDKGFWDSVADFFFPEEDRTTYAEGLRRGGYLVTVNNIAADRFDEAVDILDDEGSVDLEARAESWRSEGWGSEGTGMGTSSRDRLYESGGIAGNLGDSSASAASGGDLRRHESSSFSDRERDVIPVVEEKLRVGKRDVSLGRVRVRSYVVEEPVSEQVELRRDHVEVERRPVDRTLSGDERAFTDRTLEAEEHAEEAIVSKDARVKEEISLRRESESESETVSDTVRHTEVEVEDDRDEPRNETRGRF